MWPSRWAHVRMLDALLSFTKAVCKSCFRIRDRYTPASSQILRSGSATPLKATNCQEILDFKEICK
jgi:methyl coenzyme M reductase subunit C